MATQLHLSVRIEDAPRYRINPGAKTGGPFAVLDIGPLDLTIDSPAELRRLADVAANAADVLEQAQDEQAKASKCCDQAEHDALKVAATFRENTTYVGRQSDGDGGWLELRNCTRCPATLAMDEAEIEAAETARRGWKLVGV